MKKYKVNVNGTEYEIAIELMSDDAAPVAPSTPTAASAPAPAASAAGVGEQIKSPMPGTILSVNVKVGDKVKAGQILMILEAMKMENEILAGVDGEISSVAVQQGATVESGALLCTIK
jgi:biotin carboxyl carrier protein